MKFILAEKEVQTPRISKILLLTKITLSIGILITIIQIIITVIRHLSIRIVQIITLTVMETTIF